NTPGIAFSVKLVGFGDADPEHVVKCVAESAIESRRWRFVGETQTERGRIAGGYIEPVQGGGLGASLGGIDRLCPMLDQVFVKGIFHPRRSILNIEQPLEICLILRKQGWRCAFSREPALPILLVIQPEGMEPAAIGLAP